MGQIRTVIQDFTLTAKGAPIQSGLVALQSVQAKDLGSFSGTIGIEVSNAENPAADDWVPSEAVVDLATLVNIPEDCVWIRAAVTRSAGSVRLYFALLG
jgi:hypothetical protein